MRNEAVKCLSFFFFLCVFGSTILTTKSNYLNIKKNVFPSTHVNKKVSVSPLQSFLKNKKEEMKNEPSNAISLLQPNTSGKNVLSLVDKIKGLMRRKNPHFTKTVKKSWSQGYKPGGYKPSKKNDSYEIPTYTASAAAYVPGSYNVKPSYTNHKPSSGTTYNRPVGYGSSSYSPKPTYPNSNKQHHHLTAEDFNHNPWLVKASHGQASRPQSHYYGPWALKHPPHRHTKTPTHTHTHSSTSYPYKLKLHNKTFTFKVREHPKFPKKKYKAKTLYEYKRIWVNMIHAVRTILKTDINFKVSPILQKVLTKLFHTLQYTTILPKKMTLTKCPYTYNKSGSLCLSAEYINETLTWWEARSFCQLVKGGDLAIFKSACQFKEALEYLRHIDPLYEHNYWVGATSGKKTDVWNFIDGSMLHRNGIFWAPDSDFDGQMMAGVQNYTILSAADFFYGRNVSNETGVLLHSIPLCQYIPERDGNLNFKQKIKGWGPYASYTEFKKYESQSQYGHTYPPPHLGHQNYGDKHPYQEHTQEEHYGHSHEDHHAYPSGEDVHYGHSHEDHHDYHPTDEYGHTHEDHHNHQNDGYHEYGHTHEEHHNSPYHGHNSENNEHTEYGHTHEEHHNYPSESHPVYESTYNERHNRPNSSYHAEPEKYHIPEGTLYEPSHKDNNDYQLKKYASGHNKPAPEEDIYQGSYKAQHPNKEDGTDEQHRKNYTETDKKLTKHTPNIYIKHPSKNDTYHGHPYKPGERPQQHHYKEHDKYQTTGIPYEHYKEHHKFPSKEVTHEQHYDDYSEYPSKRPYEPHYPEQNKYPSKEVYYRDEYEPPPPHSHYSYNDYPDEKDIPYINVQPEYSTTLPHDVSYSYAHDYTNHPSETVDPFYGHPTTLKLPNSERYPYIENVQYGRNDEYINKKVIPHKHISKYPRPVTTPVTYDYPYPSKGIVSQNYDSEPFNKEYYTPEVSPYAYAYEYPYRKGYEQIDRYPAKTEIVYEKPHEHINKSPPNTEILYRYPYEHPTRSETFYNYPLEHPATEKSYIK